MFVKLLYDSPCTASENRTPLLSDFPKEYGQFVYNKIMASQKF
jgi:hypothetical protein